MVRRSEPLTIDLSDLSGPLRAVLESAVDGVPVQLLRDGREVGALVVRSAVLDGVVLPAAHPEPAPQELPQGVTVVATAMKLSQTARRRLADEFGADYVVLDLMEAPETTDVLLIHPVSPQLLGQLRASFPQARIIVVEIDDEELGVDYTGPVSRLLQAGASAYLPPRSVADIASIVHDHLTGEAAPALQARRAAHPQLPAAGG